MRDARLAFGRRRAQAVAGDRAPRRRCAGSPRPRTASRAATDAELADARRSRASTAATASRSRCCARTLVADAARPCRAEASHDRSAGAARDRPRPGPPRRPAKVRGTATYAYETPVEHPAYCSRCRRRSRAAGSRRSTRPRREASTACSPCSPPQRRTTGSTDDAELAVLQSDEVAFRGQFVGVGGRRDLGDRAAQAADLVRSTYDEQPHDVELSADRADLYAPEQVNPAFPTDTSEGDVAAAWRRRRVTVEQTYTTAM